MKPYELSNYQLYALLQDEKLCAVSYQQKNIGVQLKEEFVKRNITNDEIALLEMEWLSKINPVTATVKASLLLKSILIFAPVLLAIILPFVWVLAAQVIWATYLTVKISKLKWRYYWLLIFSGYIFWSAIVIILAKYIIK